MMHAVFAGSFESLESSMKDLVMHAERAFVAAYAPYSNFLVGAALLMEDHSLVLGSNQENAAYPSGLCAERVALFSAAAQQPGKKILALAVVARPERSPSLIPVTPCGGCRQVMVEMEMRQQHPFRVVMQCRHDEWVVLPSAESLLPYCFTAGHLDKGQIQ
jgi:cytidine deaminase